MNAPESPSIVPVPPGRIFPDSVNLYDDEARIAFDYLRQAANKIIEEEDQIEARRRETRSQVDKASQEAGQHRMVSIVAFVVAALLGIGLAASGNLEAGGILGAILAVVGITYAVKSSTAAKELERQKTILGNLDASFNAIRRDYSIDKLGVAYVPVATSVPFEDKSFVLDDTGDIPPTEFSLYQMNNQGEFLSAMDRIRSERSTLPLIESGNEAEDIPTEKFSGSVKSVRLHDCVGDLDRSLRFVAYLLNDLRKTSVSLPVIDPKGPYAAFLREFGTEDVGSLPVLPVFDQRTYADELARFEEMNQVRKRMAEENTKLEEMLRGFIVDISDRVQTMSRAKLTSSNKIVDFSNALLLNSFKASYNHYSPLLEAEEIQRLRESDFDYKAGEEQYRPLSLSAASRVRFDAISGNWVAEDGSRTSHPFGIHQIQEEIIAPLVQNLLRETRTQRLAIYTDIMTQKRDYLDRWHRDVDDFYGRGRSESQSIISHMQDTLAEFNTAISQYKAYEDTDKGMQGAGDDLDAIDIKVSGTGTAFSIAYCEEQTRQIKAQQDEFNDYIQRLNEDIDRRAQSFEYTRYYDAFLRDGHAKEVVTAMEQSAALDERQKRLLDANAYIAANAQLPPAPDIDDAVYAVLGRDLRSAARDAIEQMDRGAPEEESPDSADTPNEGGLHA